MDTPACTQAAHDASGPRPVGALTVLSIVYLCLLVYASLMPFDMTDDPARIRRQLDGCDTHWPFGSVHQSRADVLSNVALYMPLGLLIASRLSLRRRWRPVGFFVALLVGIMTSLLVEAAQVFSLSRVTSATDLLMNTIGSAAGALAGCTVGPGWVARLSRVFSGHYARRPLVLVAWLMLLMLTADALFPLRPTLDLGTIAHDVKRSAWFIDQGFARHTWHHWVVCRVGVYAALTVLLGASMRQASRRRWVRSAVLVGIFATIIELGKIPIVSRTANIANVISSLAGGVLGGGLGALLKGKVRPRQAALVAAVLIAGYVIYGELTPFTFGTDWDAAMTKMPKGIAWLPLYHYAMGPPRQGAESVRLFVRSVILLGALTWSIATWRGVRFARLSCPRVLVAALVAGIFGLALEFGQCFLPGRTPSTTEGFCFALGSILGLWVFAHYPPGGVSYENVSEAPASNASS